MKLGNVYIIYLYSMSITGHRTQLFPFPLPNRNSFSCLEMLLSSKRSAEEMYIVIYFAASLWQSKTESIIDLCDTHRIIY